MTHFWHPFADMSAVSGTGAITLVGGEGAHVVDDTGRRYLDATASLWYCNVGWGRREIADAAAAQMAELPAYSTSRTSRRPRKPSRTGSPRSPRPRLQGLLHEQRLGLDRHSDEDGAPLLAAPRRAGAHDPDPPREGLPRRAHHLLAGIPANTTATAS